VADDLSTPLGRRSSNKGILVPKTALRATVGVLGLCLFVFAGWAMFADDPLGGEPMADVAVDLHRDGSTGPKSDGAANASNRPLPNALKSDGSSAGLSGNHTVTIINGTNGQRQEVTVPKPIEDKPIAAIDERLLEATRHGKIPQISTDGIRASDLYSRPVDPTKGDGPRIAIVVSGLAVSGATTSEALAKLPSAMTLAFTPYGSDVDRIASRARGEGHEILLQLPMEPFDYPDNDPGPQTLLVTLAPEQNIDRLQWLMGRVQGYVGVMNYMGARFTANDQAFAPILREISKRGLIYVDDGTSPRSVAGQIAGANAMPYAKAALVLDAVPTPMEIDRALSKLEAMAKDKGFAVGEASALPVSIDRLSQWAKGAESRGFVLVPITAIAVKTKAS
jgi:uncharacterized protein